MSGSRWVIIPSWLSWSWRSFLYSYSVYSCHLFLISSASVHYLILNCRKTDWNIICANSCCGPCYPKEMFKNGGGGCHTGQNGFWLSLSLWKWLSWDAVSNGCSFDGSSFKEGCSRDLNVPPSSRLQQELKVTIASICILMVWLLSSNLGPPRKQVFGCEQQKLSRLMSVAIRILPMHGEAWRVGLVDNRNLGLTWEVIPRGGWWMNWRFWMFFFSPF